MQPKTLFGSRQQSYPFHGSGNKKTCNSGVKTPALLFYKPNNSNVQKNKPILHGNDHKNLFAFSDAKCSKNGNQQLSRRIDLACENHSNIAAKYVSKTEDEQQQIFYCESCASLLTQQGFQVSLLTINYQQPGPMLSKKVSQQNLNKKAQVYPFPERQQEIQNFLQNLKQAKEDIDQNHSQVRQILINSQQFYGQQIQQINEYFQTVIQSLELEKNKCYNHILLERQNAEKDVRRIVQKLAQGERQITSMMADIQQNLDSVYSISWHNYKLVMDAFQSRMSQVANIILDVKQKGINDVQYRKIQFAGVPQSINSLSQIIIQNSYGSIPSGDGTLLLTEGGSSINKNQSLNGNQQQISIFQKLKTDYSSDSAILEEQANHMMFSFDGQKMRTVYNIRNDEKQNNQNHQKVYEEDLGLVKLRKNKTPTPGLNKQSEFPERVQGIKQVQELDVVVIDDEGLMSFPPNLRLAR